MPVQLILIPLGLLILGVTGILGASLAADIGGDGGDDGFLDDAERTLEAGTRTIGALTALVLAGGAVFLGTRLIKG